MTKTLQVNVTEPLIERATARDSRHCMIAEAILSANPQLRNVMVDLATIRWSNPKTGKRYIALTPEIAGARLVEFDQGREITPFEFRVEAIQITPMKRATETRAEARADGREHARATQDRGRKKVAVSGHGDVVIHGGTPLPTGHLSNRGDLAPTPPDTASNATRSARRYRQYGRRLLQG